MALSQEEMNRLTTLLDTRKSSNFSNMSGSNDGALQTIKDVGIGVAKGIGDTVNNVASLGRPVLAALDPNKTTQDYKPADDSVFSNENLKADNTAQKVGKGVELIAEFLLPIGKTKFAAKGAEKVSTAINNAKTATSNVAKSIASPVTSSLNSENIMQRVARIPKGAQAKFEKNTGESVGKYLTKRGIYGDTDEISQQLFKRFTDSKATADEALAQLPGTYSAPQIKTALNELAGKVARTSAPGAADPDLARVTELVAKEATEGLTMTEVNEAKRIFERRVRLDFLKTNVPEDVARASNIDNAIRSWQFEKAKELGLKNLPEINNETRFAKELLDAIGKESAGSAGNNALSLTDYILLAGGDPTAIGAFLGKKTFSSKGLQSSIAKKLYKGEIKGPIKAEFKTTQ